LEKAGAHIIGIKDMAGVCKPRAITALVKALKDEVGLPLHFHTHDTSGIAAASVLAAVEAGCDAVDGALDALSGLTSQPNLGSIAAALKGSERDPQIDLGQLQSLSHYWEGVRHYYVPFEPEIRSGTSDVYNHEMPGGQYTNLREQARAMGLEHRWPEISKAYAEVNRLFGDIVKVTPTSKVVGDMAIFMVANDLKPEDVADPEKDISFPESVISLFKGELGFPPEGFPKALEAKVLKGEKPLAGRAGDFMAPVDLDAKRKELEHAIGRHPSDSDLASYLMYPKVFRDYAEHRREFGDVSLLPTSPFFYGLQDREEVAIDIDKGKTLVVRQTGRAEAPDEEGKIKVFFELNGQPRTTRVPKAGLEGASKARAKADGSNTNHVGAPMPGMVVTVAVKPGQKVAKGAPLLSIEAMKMETMLSAERDVVIKAIHIKPGDVIAAKDLLIEID
ncbi:MAG: biotin/lipoyl-containing protein, partial [Pseudomonadota bacterium]